MPATGRSAQPMCLRWLRRIGIVTAAAWLAGCAGILNTSGDSSSSTPAAAPADAPTVAGGVKVGLILPLTATGNAGAAGQAMRNSADLALTEFTNPNIQLLTKDDSGTAQGAQQAAQQAIDEGAEIILGPLFNHSVTAARQVARTRGIPIIAFSTDTNVASQGVYLLSYLPDSDVDRIVSYAISQNKRSFVAMVPSNAYGSVVEAEFKQAVARKGGRVMALEHYPDDRSRIGDPARLVAQAAAAGRADALFIPDSGEAVNDVLTALGGAGLNLRQFVILGTQLWKIRKSFPTRRLTALGIRPRIRPAFALLRSAIAPATGKTRRGRRRSPMTRCPSSRPSSRRSRVRTNFPMRC